MRAVPVRCEFIEGIPRPEGKGTKMIYCLGRPTFSFSIFEISPLFLCDRHLHMEVSILSYYIDDIEVLAIP